MAKRTEIIDRCTQYAVDVIAGKEIAGEYVKLACQRHLDDLEKSKAAPYIYYFDVEKSEEIINFAEELVIAEGDEEEQVTCYPFQCFILVTSILPLNLRDRANSGFVAGILNGCCYVGSTFSSVGLGAISDYYIFKMLSFVWRTSTGMEYGMDIKALSFRSARASA